MGEFTFKDKHGDYHLSYSDRVVTAKLNGALGSILTRNFCRDMRILINHFNLPAWGYFGDLSHSEAETPQAQKMMIELHGHMMNRGCVVDAYVVNNPLALHQVNSSRRAAGITTDLSKQIFQDKASAIEFIHDTLNTLTNSTI
ncbi:MAG: hypothetical protein NWQ54_06895 [Paraglaciecola sp.]|uniref:hypothetical protein n=1 Tax=Pseudomonadati TaxID=3379134 RepID=UPI00273FA206|nr:hypothetical protein [Paraglaciecola sp.]MDP5032789.1 hypothetical protein [Paraglaciecola sp.]MDP5130593.1 hypothetical protein [Paraglaciecola sp.]